MKSCRFLLGLVYLAFCCNAFAQSTNASLTGFADDPSKAMISGVSITAINTQTGVRASTVTNREGQYALPGLNPGEYRLEVDKQGFKGIIEAGLVLHVQDVVQINFHMAIGSASESVTVDASGVQVNTTDASVSTVVDRKFVENMPLNGRSFQDLISMTPGVNTQSPQQSAVIGGQGDFSVNGQRTESNAYSVDGVSANTNAGFPNGYAQSATGGTISAGTALGTTQSLISVDALQEFRITSSSYSAEFGRFPGGQISLSTRSGTNIFHGTVFDYLRNDLFDANDWFNNHNGANKTAIRQNDFGGTLGGPIVIPHLYHGQDKTFFFVSYEGLRLVLPTAATTQYVPSLAVRSGTAAVLQPIFDAFPLPTGPEVQIPCTAAAANCPAGSPIGTSILSGLSPFIKNYSLPGAIDSTSVRVDHRLTPKQNLFFRVGYSPTSASTRVLSNLSEKRFLSTTYTVGLTSQFTTNLSNELRYGYTTSESSNKQTLDSFGGAQPLNLANAFGIPGSYTNVQPWAYLQVAGVGTTYAFDSNVANHLKQHNLTDTFEIAHGHHSFKFGVDFRHVDAPLNPVLLTTYGFFFTRQEMLSNVTDSIQITKNIASTPVFNQFSAFAQDEWKVRPNLTLSVGIRWDVAPPPTEANGNNAYTVRGNINDPSSLAVAPQGTPLYNTVWTNFAPRLGVAWLAHSTSGWETVLRTGGGVFYDTGSQVSTGGYSALGFNANEVLSSVPLPFTPSQFDFSVNAAPPYTNDVGYAFPPHMQLPYTLQWNAAIQQSLGKAQSFTATYIGSSGRRLLIEQEIANPNFAILYYLPGGMTSSYNALQLSFQRSVAKGLQGLASYTWSHSLDFGSTSTSIPATYGNSDYDVRNNFQAGLTWDLPHTSSSRIVQTLLDGWGLDGRVNARTAFPITLTGNALENGIGSIYYSGVNYDPSRSPYVYGSQYPGGKALNGGANNTSTPAFTSPSGSAAGDAPRNFARGFGAFQVNTAVRRVFPLREGLALQLRAEAFNVFNHPIFGYVDPALTDAQFGQATMTLSQSLGGETSSLYQQGGARSMQFALKVLF